MEYVKIDRGSGEVLKRKTSARMERVFDKPTVWLPLERVERPAFDPEVYKLVAKITQPDLSDLTKKVPVGTKRIETWNTVKLTEAELVTRAEVQISLSDPLLTRAVEDLLVLIATNQTLTRAMFADAIWENVNKRRKLRKQDPV